MLPTDIIIYVGAFLAIWAGAGFIISAVDKLSRKLHISSFAMSFFVLGILTSMPEFAVGLTSISEGNPEIFVGTLLGGVMVLFLFVIPLLAIFGRGIKLNHDLGTYNIALCLVIIAAPALMILDKKLTNSEGLLLLLLYSVLLFVIQSKHGIFDRKNARAMQLKAYSLIDIFKILGGVALVFIASHIIVDKTIYFAQILRVSPFYISLIGLSFGTNLPELFLAIRAIISGKKEIAFGDYLGSAAANTLLFGVFTLLTQGEILTVNRFIIPFLFITGGLSLFFYFTRTKNDISRKEGVALLGLYGLFLFVELFLK